MWVEGESPLKNVIIYLSDKFMGNVGLELGDLVGWMGGSEGKLDLGEIGEDGGRRWKREGEIGENGSD